MQTEAPTAPSFTLVPVFGRDLTPDDPAGDKRAHGDPPDDGVLCDDLPGDPDRPLTPERRLLCMIVRQLTLELLQAVGIETDSGGKRRATSHVRQVAMYVCHVAYSMPFGEVAQAFGLDRSTVRHACRMVENRRDDPAYDGFVTIVERMASAVHLLAGRRP